jgi:NADH-quinone oxidoreductase subunit N
MSAIPNLANIPWLYRIEITLVVGALVLLLAAPRIDRSRVLPALLGLITVFVAAGSAAMTSAVFQPGIFLALGVLALGLLLLASAELYDVRQQPEAAALMLLGALGAIVLVTGRNLVELALGVELISLTGAALIALGRGERPLEAAFKYFLLTAVTFAMLLFGMALIFVGTGKLIVPNLQAVNTGLLPIAALGVLMFAIGLCFKLAVVPVHFGGLDAYTAGPSSFVGFLMVVSKLGAGAALVRFAGGAGEILTLPLLVMGLASIVFAVLASFAQTDLRRLLAYSAVAHAGFLAVGAASGVLGGKAVTYYVIGYGAAAMLAFAVLAGTGTGPLPLAALRPGGEVRLGPARAIGLTVALLSLAGVPPFPGFWVKLAILKACWEAWGLGVTAVVALGGVLGIIYYLRPLPDLFAAAKENPGNGTLGSLVATGLALAAVVVLGLAPGLIWPFIR